MKAYTRRIMLYIIDLILINAAVYYALYFRFDGDIPIQYLIIFIHYFLLFTAIKGFIYYFFGLYTSLWRYASIYELLQIFYAVSLGSVIDYVLGLVLNAMYPRSVYLAVWILTLLLVGGIRLSYRILRRLKNINIKNINIKCINIKDIKSMNIKNINKKSINGKKRVMIIGAGDAGSMVIKELESNEELQHIPVIVIDDDNWKHNSSIHGVPIVGGRDKIKKTAEEYNIDEIIVAIPSVNKSEMSEILKICKETKCKLKTLPGVYEIISNKVSIKNIRDVNIEDLLGRDEIKLNTEEIAGYLENETVLVTGGGGSIGSELCRQIAIFKPRKLLIFDIYENNAYDLQNELIHTYRNKLDLEVLIGSVRDKERLREIFRKYRPGVVFHAAAHKHVPLMEINPAEAIKNNVFGTLNTAQCADESGTKRFVLISTDKAVNPTNIMGATKRVAEMIVQSMDMHSSTEFVAVRFGNVLESNGSVIPLFKKQIAQGGPVTVTHPEITRYFMTIPEAVRLVIQAGAMAMGGEIFILDMGKPVKIVDLARDLIRLSGFEPDVDIKIEYTGLRPGEKLYEELLLAGEGIKATRHSHIFVGKPVELSYYEVLLCMKTLENSLDNHERLRECVSNIVTTYTYDYEEVAAAK